MPSSRISRSTHGFPCAARPIITAEAPVVARTAWARAREVTSPEAITGTSTRSTSSAVSAWSAVPVYICFAERGCSVSVAAPASTSRGADVEARPRAVFEPAAHLHAHRQVDRRRDRRHDLAGPVRVVEQGRARSGLGDLADGAAEVDVDDVRSGVRDHAGGLGHHGGVRPEDLHGERVLVAGDPQVAERPLVPVVEPGAADHLGADEPGPVAAALAPKRLHADARHRGEDEPRRDLDVADPPGLMEIFVLPA